MTKRQAAYVLALTGILLTGAAAFGAPAKRSHKAKAHAATRGKPQARPVYASSKEDAIAEWQRMPDPSQEWLDNMFLQSDEVKVYSFSEPVGLQGQATEEFVVATRDAEEIGKLRDALTIDPAQSNSYVFQPPQTTFELFKSGRSVCRLSLVGPMSLRQGQWKWDAVLRKPQAATDWVAAVKLARSVEQYRQPAAAHP